MKGLLLSGGMDSIAVAYWCKPQIAFTIDYGQLPAKAEIQASAAVSNQLGLRHEIVTVNLSHLGSGDLAGQKALDFAPASEWWPFRNQMLLSIAAMKAVTMGVDELMIGTVASDSFHADGSARFVQLMDELLSMQEGQLRVSAPGIHLNSVELIQHISAPQSLLAWSHSCHVSDLPCGVCRGCCKHYNVTAELGWDSH